MVSTQGNRVLRAGTNCYPPPQFDFFYVRNPNRQLRERVDRREGIAEFVLNHPVMFASRSLEKLSNLFAPNSFLIRNLYAGYYGPARNIPRVVRIIVVCGTMLWIMVISGCAVLLMSPTANSGETVVHRFGPGSFGDPMWERRYNAELESFRLERDGWVIDFKPEAGTASTPLKSGGFRSMFAVEGDFRVTIDFAVMRIVAPNSTGGTDNSEPGIFLRVTFGDDQHLATIGLVRPNDASWAVKGQLVTASERTPFREKVLRPLSQLTISRIGETVSFSGQRGNAQPTIFHASTTSGRLDTPGQIKLWVTSGKEAVPMQLKIRSVVVESDKMGLGHRAAVKNTSAWRTASILFAITLAVCIVLAVYRRVR